MLIHLWLREVCSESTAEGPVYEECMAYMCRIVLVKHHQVYLEDVSRCHSSEFSE